MHRIQSIQLNELKRISWHIRRQKIPADGLRSQNSALLAADVGVVITSYLNPSLINPMGILLVMQLSAANRCENQ